ncbi:hypothetical protein OP10G_3902 [Fimbriimonas ginsengisoli Gsoil 348]|uniref:Uncharacterized protein n=1 Tax=Fimbriimonas ginsengisoli Gsoil 348 TaxID=661478 RepID=A0A068NWW2_FIMGI|nr:hypothetical protein OP10G_3902 [Fimbriimonas ginsengisoli Gsoil 348]
MSRLEHARLRLELFATLTHIIRRIAGGMIFSVDHMWLDGTGEWAFPFNGSSRS